MQELSKNILNPKGKYGIWGIAALVILGVALMIVPGLFLEKKTGNLSTGNSSAGNIGVTAINSVSSLNQAEKDLAGEITGILSQVEGAGKVAVSVTLETGPEQDYATNTSDDKSTVEEKDGGGGSRITTGNNQKTEVVFAQGQGEALVVKEIAPKIKGVLVVAEGARDAGIREKISKAVQTMLNLPAYRVMVLPKEGK
jgi:stage III sporulation protein AG